MNPRQKIKILSLIVLSFLLLSACSTKSKTIMLTEKDQGSSVNMNKRDLLVIELEGNPTTGYTWEMEPDSLSILSVQSEPEFIQSDNTLGSGGIIKFTFIAVAKGSDRLTIIYHRPWEENVPPEKIFSVTVNIE